jgi:DNA-binding SARP family transcriptional activator/DNA-binding beta-propeller fold protein YncE
MEYRVLGPLEVLAGGKPVPLGPPKQRVVLGTLLLHANEVVSTERLVDELWGERPPPSAPKVIQGYVSQLRKAMGEAGAGSVIKTRAPGYVASVADEEIDADRFQRLVAQARSHREEDDARVALATYDRALGCWRGAAFADVPFESFGRSESERLEELRVAALAERIDCELELGRHERVVAGLEPLVTEHPLRERFRAQLMLALYRSGRQADALAAYQEARRRLVEELGIEPGPELRALEQAILRQDASLAAPAAPARTIARPRLNARRLRLLAAVLAVAAVVALVVAVVHRPPPSRKLASGTIGMIDPATNRITATVGTGIAAPVLSASRGILWVGGDGTVARVDARTGKLTGTVAVGGAVSSIAADTRTTWVGTRRPELVAIDTPSLGIRTRVPLPPTTPHVAMNSDPAPALALGGGRVWAVAGVDSVRELDPLTGRVLDTISPLAGTNRALGWGAGALWVGGPSAVSRVVPDLHRVTATIRIETVPVSLAFGDGSVWLALDSGAAPFTSTGIAEVVRLNPTSEAPAATIPLPDSPTALVAAPSGIWVASAAAGAVYRIDPKQNRIVATIRTGAAPTALAATPAGIWVGVS